MFLTAVPKVNVSGVYVKPFVSQNKLQLEVTVENNGQKTVSVQLQADIYKWINKAGGKTMVTVEIPVKEGELDYWTPEHPNLNALLLSLRQGKNVIDVKYERFGWREWTFRGTEQCLNGKPYPLKGDSWHFHGIPQMTRRYAWAWYTAIKDMNANAVRLHAQVYPKFYMDMADELGICVLDETANWASDGGPKLDSELFWAHFKDHLKRFIERDRNHPSVFGWSISNETSPSSSTFSHAPTSCRSRRRLGRSGATSCATPTPHAHGFLPTVRTTATAYVFVGGGGVGCYGGKLKRDNWLELDGGMKKMEGLNADFHEAPFLFKKDGKYYMTHSDNNPEQLGGNQLMYAIGDSPLGPWRDGGVYMLPHAEETAHGSIVQFKGKWYQFWHNANYSGRGNLRSVCCSPVTFAEDGSINIIRTWGSPKGGKLPMLNASAPLVIEAEDYNDGGSQVGFFKRGDNQTYTYGKLDVQPMKVKTDGGVTYIADMQRKEWARWSFFATETGTHTLRCRVRNNGNSEGRFYVGIDGHWTAREEIKVTSKAGEWSDIEVKDVRIAAGEHFLMWRAMFGNIDVDRITIE